MVASVNLVFGVRAARRQGVFTNRNHSLTRAVDGTFQPQLLFQLVACINLLSPETTANLRGGSVFLGDFRFVVNTRLSCLCKFCDVS